jgi:membrane-associated phospholipid phosphatase
MTAQGKRRLVIVAGWLVAFVAALLLDRAVAVAVAPIAQTVKHSALAPVIKFPGWFPCTALIAIAIALWHPWRWRGGGTLLVSGIVAGAMYTIAKWAAGRVRPIKVIAPFEFSPFPQGFAGLFTADNLSFPSGHATLAFASAATLAHLLPRYRWLFYAIAAIVGIERVLEQAHYLSDVVAAAAFGIGAFHISLFVLSRLFAPREPESRSASTEVNPT